MSYFESILELQKEQFEPYRALIILDEKMLRKYVICWGPQLVRRHNDYPINDTLADLWDCVTVDYQALAELTGDSLPQVMAYFRQAQGLQLIYPDGTLAGAVVNVLKKKMMGLGAD